MKAFMTPPKQISNRMVVNSMPRQGDWICLNCNNLNFAFRKVCNRCKFQTKQRNQQLREYYRYQFDSQLQINHQESLKDVTNTIYAIKLSTPKKKQPIEDPQKSTANKNLPSVSPLVRKYVQAQKQMEKIVKQKSIPKFLCSPLSWESQWPITTLDFAQIKELQQPTSTFQENSLDEQYGKMCSIDDQIEQMVNSVVF